MAFEIHKEKYTGAIAPVTLGAGDKAVVSGGEGVYPFHKFEGETGNPPSIFMEVWDIDPGEEWPDTVKAHFEGILGDPLACAKKCVEEYGADGILLSCQSSDPNAADRPVEEVAERAAEVVNTLDVPVVVWGTYAHDKDPEIFRLLSEKVEGKNVVMGPAEEGDYKPIGAGAMGYSHTVGASTPIDVNLAKQLNILLGNLGLKADKIIMDPTTGGLGYGLEYTYSVLERIKQAALTQGDTQLQVPIFTYIGVENWKCKEAKQTAEEAPELGDPEKRGYLMEAVTAVCMLVAGANMVVLRHPEAVRLTKWFIEGMTAE